MTVNVNVTCQHCREDRDVHSAKAAVRFVEKHDHNIRDPSSDT